MGEKVYIPEKSKGEMAESIVLQIMNKSITNPALKTVNLPEIRDNQFLNDILDKQNPEELEEITKKLKLYLNSGSQPLMVRATEVLKKINTPNAKKLLESLKNHPDIDVRRITRR